MKKRYIVFIHLGLFAVLFITALLSSEALLNWLMPGFSDVGSWIILLFSETIFLLIVTSISCIIFIRRQLKTKDNDSFISNS